MKIEPHFQTASSIKKRISAFILDYCMIGSLMVLTIFLLLGPNLIDKNNSNLSSIMLIVILPGVLLFLAKDSFKGVSFGKWIVGIMVRDANNLDEVPSFGRLFMRNLFLIIWPLELIVLALSHDKRRFGDKNVNTMVLEKNTKQTERPMIFAVTGMAISVFVFMFLFAGTAMKNSDAYKVAVREIEANEEILKETGGIKGYGIMPTGSINTTNGSGQAELSIKVLGNIKDLKVNVYLTKVPEGKWNILKIDR